MTTFLRAAMQHSIMQVKQKANTAQLLAACFNSHLNLQTTHLVFFQFALTAL